MLVDTVEAVVEEEHGRVECFIKMMKEDPRMSQVDDSKVEWENPTGEFQVFGVRRSI